ncbi:GTP pyrophosphokinase [Pectobacterium zantedeschiae]|uniref:GTP pyrophosphokinase n=1 Tax=Pectobacterium zantedeschiae TaxID=2034769 RepID=UPI00101BD8B2|nr:RelA/SpoT domain-containing protein [Pectobacterium zantedeschiae]RYC43269.1 GTP pyrophosphokinase [Pectobacterium zantedeschiae]
MSQIIDDWLLEYLPKYELLGKYIVFILENQLQSKNIDYLSVTYRTKTKEGVYEKINRKKYKDPINQMTDVSGIRVILYFESDIEKVSSIIEELFTIDIKNSVNNENRLSSNKIGYRSIHYVCDIGDKRKNLVEYEFISGLKCEIQVRTMLQHAWAELTHDRNYKLSGKLPLSIERKINLYSGMLEIADIGFSEIINAVSDYKKELSSKNITISTSESIDSLSLIEFARQIKDEIGLNFLEINPEFDPFMDELLSEISFMEISTFTELRSLIPDNYVEVCKEYNIQTNQFGFIRDILLIKDFRKLHNCPSVNWFVADSDDSDDFDKTVSFYSNFMAYDEARELVNLFDVQNIHLN